MLIDQRIIQLKNFSKASWLPKTTSLNILRNSSGFIFRHLPLPILYAASSKHDTFDHTHTEPSSLVLLQFLPAFSLHKQHCKNLLPLDRKFCKSVCQPLSLKIKICLWCNTCRMLSKIFIYTGKPKAPGTKSNGAIAPNLYKKNTQRMNLFSECFYCPRAIWNFQNGRTRENPPAFLDLCFLKKEA